MTTEIENRLKEFERTNKKRVWLSVISGFVPLLLALAGAGVLGWVMQPIQIDELSSEISTIVERDGDWKAYIQIGHQAVSNLLARARNLFNVASIILAISLGLCITILFEMWRSILRIDRVNYDIQESQKKTKARLDDLESRHNIITKGTDFGRVLALRNFENQDLEEGDSFYNKHLTANHCVLSTLMLDRAEELLTSAKYMNFFVDKTPPNLGYFRLVLARKPKDFEGLSAYMAISKKLEYRTALLPLRCWIDVVKPSLEVTLPDKEFKGLVQLIERNTELGIGGHSVKDADLLHKLQCATLQDTIYCGRIEKSKTERIPGNATITHFLKESHKKNLHEISPESVQAYWRLMAFLCANECTDKFDMDGLEVLFRGAYDSVLATEIQKVFRAA